MPRTVVAAIAACLLALAAACASLPPQPVRILFVGNSLTYYNDLPAKFAALHAAAQPRTPLQTDMLVTGGGSLRNRLREGVLETLLARTRFDIVVLQDVGGWPLCPPEHRECKDSPRALQEAATLVRRAGARPFWFATWQPDPAAQRALSAAGAELASAAELDHVDVGAALQRVDRSAAGAMLRADGHPAHAGSWLAAALLLHALEPDIALLATPPRACGRRWEGSGLRADRLASEHPVPPPECNTPTAWQWAAIRAAVITASDGR
jgi:hypothetical protein